MRQSSEPIDPELAAFVHEFREAAQGVGPDGGFVFPCGACNWSCEILGQLLAQKGFGTWFLVKGEGELENPRADLAPLLEPPGSAMEYITHDWLEMDGICIDPTADQFQERVEFEGKDLPFIHRGDSPLSAVFTMKIEDNSRRDIVVEGVHRSASLQNRMIRAKLGMEQIVNLS